MRCSAQDMLCSNAAEAGRSRSRALDDKQNLVPSFDYAQNVASRGLVALPGGLGWNDQKKRLRCAQKQKNDSVLIIQYDFQNDPLGWQDEPEAGC